MGMTCWKDPLRRQRLVRSITWATRIQWQWPTWLSVLSFLSENTETSTRQGLRCGGKVENTWPNWVSCVSYGKNITIQVFEEPPDTTRNASRNAWLQRRLRRAIGKKAIKNYVPMPPTGDVLKTSADVSLATRRKAQLVNAKADKKPGGRVGRSTKRSSLLLKRVPFKSFTVHHNPPVPTIYPGWIHLQFGSSRSW
jgi:hypothetical protein